MFQPLADKYSLRYPICHTFLADLHTLKLSLTIKSYQIRRQDVVLQGQHATCEYNSVPADPFHQLRQAYSRLTKSQTASLSHVSNPSPPHGRGVLVSTLYRTIMQSFHANVQIQIDRDRGLLHTLQLIIQQ